MRSHRWRSIQLGLPESAHGCPELVKHALLVEANGMCRNRTEQEERRGVWGRGMRLLMRGRGMRLLKIGAPRTQMRVRRDILFYPT